MKCIRTVDGIKRVGDKEAAALVQQGKAVYVEKSRWKESGRKYK